MRVPVALLVSAASVTASTSVSDGGSHGRPFFTVPTLTQIRDILANLEGPIISTIVERFSLPVDPSLNQGNHSKLHTFLAMQEKTSANTGRYDYGSLEYPFTLPPPAPDAQTSPQQFPPGRFRLDRFYQNAELFTLYTNTIIPMINSSSISTFFFHLANGTNTPGARDRDAALHLDASLLALMSHRAHIGKIVAEAKYAGNATQYTALIEKKDADGIRALLTNTTQEGVVLAQANETAISLGQAWQNTGLQLPEGFEASVQGAAFRVFRGLIDITTNIEIEYLLERLSN